MIQSSANERTFQGIFLSLINRILGEEDFRFSKITQEENIGVGEARFADGLLYSKTDIGMKTLFELKDTSWDATDEVLVNDAMMKAFKAGIKYFVTGTPRQLVIYETFRPNTQINDRKLRIFYLSNIRKNADALTPAYEKQILPRLIAFLKELQDIIHEVKIVRWDSIDRYFVNKLSAFILEASAEMADLMHGKIHADKEFKKALKEYLTTQDLFNIDFSFEQDEVYKICQLVNYLLYLKIMFYSYLQREVPALQLKILEIPEQKSLLNKILRARFDDVLKHDFDAIFEKSILDDFEFEDKYIPVLKRNVEEIRNLNFKDLNCDIIGAIYNTLIDNQEQHYRGQHFTNTNEVDIVNAFCVNEKTQFVLDSGCGAGTFLVRAYAFLKKYRSHEKHEQLLERLWGVEIAPFPVFLSTMNLSLLNIAELDNYPVIIHKDFSDVTANSRQKLLFLNSSHSLKVKRLDGKHSEVIMPEFDACIGNPPYVRQEHFEHKARWNNLAKVEWSLKKVNQQSDLYLYYLMHTAAFLKEGGRFGYVISDSWLDVAFGRDLQKFLLDNFKIVAIINHQRVRSFETALITTVILILERCSNRKTRESNPVRFVRVYDDYEALIGSSDDENRIEEVQAFAHKIENASEHTQTKSYSITVRSQKALEEDNTFDGKYENGHWGATYFRSPEIFNKLIAKAADKLAPMFNYAEVKYGIKTGANEFFYVGDDTKRIREMGEEEYLLNFGVHRDKHKIDWKTYGWYYSAMTKQHHILERRMFKLVFKTQSEADNLDVNLKKLKWSALICNETKTNLRKYKYKLLKYIEEAEDRDIHNGATCSARVSPDHKRDWFHLGSELFIGDFIFPAKIGEYYRLIDNRVAKVYCDKVNYNIRVKDEYKKYFDILFLILNSITFRFFIDLFSRQMVVKISDVDVNVVERTLIVRPELLVKREKELQEILESLKSRPQGTIYDEVKQPDRKRLDTIIFESLGLTEKDVEELYDAATKYVKDRSEKSESVITTKKKQKLDYEGSLKLIQERFPEVRRYDELLSGIETKTFTVPNFKAKFSPTSNKGDSNLFGHYDVYFKDGSNQITVRFENIDQLKLFQFLHEKLEIKGVKLVLPQSPDGSQEILKAVKHDFEKNIIQIKNTLKSFRSKANYLSVYRDLLFLSD